MKVKTQKKETTNQASAHLLYRIAKAMATVKDGRKLLKIIVENAQPVFGFHDVGLFILSKDGERITDWAVAHEQINPSAANRQLKEFEMESLAVKESPLQIIIERLTDAGAPLIFPYSDEYVNSVTDSKVRKKLKTVIEDGGYQEFLATILKSGGKMLGVLFFNSKQKDFFKAKQFNLFQSFADQIAVAVANILAGDEIIHQLAEIKELKKRLEAENVYLNEEIGKNYNFDEIIGTSAKLHQVFEVIEQVAPTDATVLI